jgi:hypothetical protein
MPIPMLNVARMSSADASAVSRIRSNTGCRRHDASSISAPRLSGITRGRFPGIPPPVMCAAAWSSPSRARAATVGA